MTRHKPRIRPDHPTGWMARCSCGWRSTTTIRSAEAIDLWLDHSRDPAAALAGRPADPRPTALVGAVDKPAWTTLAACVGMDPDIFFDPDTTDVAVAACRSCPVTGACLAHAVATREKHGVWGGQTAQQRRSAARRRAAR